MLGLEKRGGVGSKIMGGGGWRLKREWVGGGKVGREKGGDRTPAVGAKMFEKRGGGRVEPGKIGGGVGAGKRRVESWGGGAEKGGLKPGELLGSAPL